MVKIYNSRFTQFFQHLLIFALNWTGDLEITCLRNFYQLANLWALLERSKFPSALHPFICKVKSLYKHKPFVPKPSDPTRIVALNKHLCTSLIIRMKNLFPIPNVSWISLDKRDNLKPEDVGKYACVNLRVTELSHLVIGNHIVFSTIKKNKNNSVVALKSNTRVADGIIEHIFQHRWVTPNQRFHTDTWFAIKPLALVPSFDHSHTLAQLENYAIGLKLWRIPESRLLAKSIVFHSSEILAHCAWMRYDAMKINRKIDYETYAVVCLDRWIIRKSWKIHII